MIKDKKSFVHKGLRDFWTSGTKDTRGVRADQVPNLRALLVHLGTATSLADIQGGLGLRKGFKALTGHKNRYELQVNGNWRLTFDCDDPNTGYVTKIDLEDVHRAGGAKRH